MVCNNYGCTFHYFLICVILYLYIFGKDNRLPKMSLQYKLKDRRCTDVREQGGRYSRNRPLKHNPLSDDDEFSLNLR